MDLAGLRDKLRGAAPNGAVVMPPPIDRAELEAVEARVGVTMPDEYRAYLTQVANGGPGPGYGLYSIEEAIEERGEGLYGLDEPFEPPRDSRECWELRVPGILPIHHDGCAYFTGLVVTGPARGTVWSYVEVAPGWIPILRDGFVGPDGEPFERSGGDRDDWARLYDAMLLPANAPRRLTFFEHLAHWLDGLSPPH